LQRFRKLVAQVHPSLLVAQVHPSLPVDLEWLLRHRLLLQA
jgi:hypothetical protein